MRFNVFIDSIEEINRLKNININEVIIAPYEISRRGLLSFEKTCSLITEAKKHNMKVYIQSDIIVEENRFFDTVSFIKNLPLDLIDAFRVQDAGFWKYIAEHLNKKIHLILENGFRNFYSVMSVIKKFQNNCERVVLTGEVPFQKLKIWIEKIPVECEILFMGRPLLFYSPRHLLKTAFDNEKDFYDIRIESEEYEKKEYLIANDTIQGTLIYHSKYLFLADFWSELKESKISVLRVDTDVNLTINDFLNLVKCAEENKFANFLNNFNNQYFHGFFKENKTTDKFSNLKNILRESRNDDFAAKVIEAYSDKPIILKAMKRINNDDKVYFVTPLGEKINFQISNMGKPFKGNVGSVEKDEVFILPKRKGVTAQSYLYIESEN